MGDLVRMKSSVITVKTKKTATVSFFGSGRRLLFEVFKDVVQSLIDGSFQTLADNVIEHLLEDAFLLFAFFLFLVAHFFTLLSMTILSGSSSSASFLAARRFNKSCWMRQL